MTEGQSIQFTRAKVRALRKAYEATDGETFTFEGHEFLVGYAKYLLEYLEGEIKRGKL
jgi:hypothetical protein